jgi:glycosyltransferase involved in cell wall biosynthesis
MLDNNYDRVVNVNNADDAPRAIAEADVIILHVSMSQIEEFYQSYPALHNKYVIGYLVWEASELHPFFESSINSIQEIWTASRYCCNIFRKHHDKVVYMPHVIERDTSYSESDSSFIREAIKYDKDYTYFLAVAAVADRRKNVKTLVEAFLNAGSKMRNAKLIIKSTWQNDPQHYIDDEQIIYLRSDLTTAQLNALYDLSNVYVSAHHSEGWGYTLSDAMLFKKPVIATGYSGNLEFMNHSNSFLLDYKEDYIRVDDPKQPWLGHMKWAYPSQADLEAKLLLLYNNINEEWVAKKVERAFEDTNRFSCNAISVLIQRRMAELRALQ